MRELGKIYLAVYDWLRFLLCLPSISTLFIIICKSSSRGFSPKERITFPSSFVVIKPLLSLSKWRNASLYSKGKKKGIGKEKWGTPSSYHNLESTAVPEGMAVFTLEDEQVVWTDKSSQMSKSSDVKTGRTNFQTTLSPEFVRLFVRLWRRRRFEDDLSVQTNKSTKVQPKFTLRRTSKRSYGLCEIWHISQTNRLTICTSRRFVRLLVWKRPITILLIKWYYENQIPIWWVSGKYAKTDK